VCAFRTIWCVQCGLLVLCVVTKMYSEGVECVLLRSFEGVACSEGVECVLKVVEYVLLRCFEGVACFAGVECVLKVLIVCC